MPSAGIYHVSKWHGRVDGVSGTRRVSLEGFAKVNTPAYPYCVANEFLASKIGVRLGITMPPGTLIRSEASNEPGWVTLSFGDALPPVNPAEVVAAAPAMSAGVVVFDILIVNTDRHRQNLALRPSQKRLEVFDHSHALFGPLPNMVTDRVGSARNALAVTGGSFGGNRQCLIDYIQSASELIGWAEKLESELPDSFLMDACEEVATFGIGPTEAECEEIAMFLLNRRNALKDLIRAERHEFKAVDASDWGMA